MRIGPNLLGGVNLGLSLSSFSSSQIPLQNSFSSHAGSLQALPAPSVSLRRFFSVLAFAGALGGGAQQVLAQPSAAGPGGGKELPVDSPHGLKAALKDFQSLPGTLLVSPEAVLMPQLLDRGNYDIEFFGKLEPGRYQNGLEVQGDSSILAKLKIRDGRPEADVVFSPFVLQHDFPLRNIPFLPETVPGELPAPVPLFSLQIRDGRFWADTPLMPQRLDVTPFITQEYFGGSQKEIDPKLSEVATKVMTRFKDLPIAEGERGLAALVDPSVSWFRILANAKPDAELPPIEGTPEDVACAKGESLDCSFFQMHWDKLALGPITLKDIDVHAFVRRDAASGILKVKIPKAMVGTLSHHVADNAPETTLSNARITDAELELAYKDPDNPMAGMYLSTGKGMIKLSGADVLGDIVLGSLGSGLSFTLAGDADGNIAADLGLDGVRLKTADLLVQGGLAVHVDDFALLDDDGDGPHGRVHFDFINGVPSYDARFFLGLKSATVEGAIDKNKFKAEAKDLACDEFSASSSNALVGSRIRLENCHGSLSGNARLFLQQPLAGLGPIDPVLKAGFKGLDADLTVGPGLFALEHFRLPELQLDAGAGAQGFLAAYHLQNGVRRLFDGEELPQGISVKTGADGRLLASVNLDQGLTVKGPPGRLETGTAILGTAAVSDWMSAKPHADFQVSLPFKTQKIEMPAGSIVLEQGGLSVKGDEKKMEADLQPPKNVRVSFVQEVDGLTYEVKGSLQSAATFHASIDVTDPGQPRVTLSQDNALYDDPLQGTVTVTVKKGGEVLSSGEVHATADYRVEGEASADRSRFSIRVPNLTLETPVTSDIKLPDFTIASGSFQKTVLTGFAGEISLEHRPLSLKSVWTALDINAAVTLAGSPVEKKVADLKGPVEVTVKGEAHGQQYRLNVASDGSVSFEGIPQNGSLAPYDLTVNAKIGESLSAMAKLTGKADGLQASFDPATGDIVVALKGIAVGLGLDGKSVLPVGLNDLDSQALVDGLTARINVKSGTVSLDVAAPAYPATTQPPEDFAAWMKWDRTAWTTYRKEMNDGRHLAVLSEPHAALPSAPFPKGRGKIFVDLKSREGGYSVALNAFGGDAQKAVLHLVSQIQGDAVIVREYPNPPRPNPMPEETVVYNEGQDTVFFLDPSDESLVARLREGLGVDDSKARTLLQNGRVDLDLLAAEPFFAGNFSIDALRGIFRAFLEDHSNPYFSKNSTRLFLALASLQGDLSKLVGFHKTFWSEKVRSTVSHVFDKAEFRGTMPAEKEGINVAAYAYLPYDVETVMAILTDTARYDDWLPWIDEDMADSLSGTRADFGPLATFSYDQKKGTKDALPVLSGRYLLIPHAKGGVLLIQEQAVDFDGADSDELEGRDEDHSDLADRSRFPLSLDILLGKTGRALNPVKDPVQIFSQLVNRAVSNLNHMLFTGQRVDFRGYKATAESLTYTPEGIQRTSTPPEFLTLALSPGDVTQEKIDALTEITLKVEASDKAIVKNMLVKGIGFTESQADEMIKAGKIDLNVLAELEYIKKDFDAATVKSLAALFLVARPGVNENFLSRSDRFAIFWKDYREKSAGWADADGDGARSLDFRSFGAAEFHRWSPHNKNQSDGNDTVCYTILPAAAPFDKVLEAVSHPDWFKEYTENGTDAGDGDYTEAAQVACADPKEGTVCIDNSFKLPALKFRLGTPDPASGLMKIGSVGVAPWWWVERPGLNGADSFEENQGAWVVVPRMDGSTLIFRFGLLNSTVQGDAALQEVAFKAVTGFMEGVYRKAVSGNGKPGTIDVTYGGLTVTGERSKEWR